MKTKTILFLVLMALLLISGIAFVIYGPNDLFYGDFVQSKKNGTGLRRYSNDFLYKGYYLNDKVIRHAKVVVGN